jgi:hypothetical protein
MKVNEVKIVALKDFQEECNPFTAHLEWVAYENKDRKSFSIALCDAKTGELYFEENWGDEQTAQKAFALKGKSLGKFFIV